MSILPNTRTTFDFQLQSARKKLSCQRIDFLLLIAALCWINYTVHGFRLPWQPILVSDSDVGARLRQVVFAMCGMLAIRRLIITQSLMTAVVRNLPWFAFGMGLTVSAIWSDNPILTVKRSMIFNFGLLTIITIIYSTNRPVQLMQRCLFITAALSAATSVVMAFTLPAACSSILERPGLAGVSNHPNTLGAMMCSGLILSWGITPGLNHITKWQLRAGQGALLIAILMTNSITAILALMIGLFVFVSLSKPAYHRGVLILAVITFMTIVIIIGPKTVKSAFFDAAQRDESLSGRDTLWPTVFKEGLKNPLFGAGFGGFWYEGRGRDLTGTWNPRQAHHAYLDVFVDLGVVGLFIVLILIWGGLWRGWQQWAGPLNSPQQHAVASFIALGMVLISCYALSQSFFLKLDQFTMFTFLWILLLLSNHDHNDIHTEFRLNHTATISD